MNERLEIAVKEAALPTRVPILRIVASLGMCRSRSISSGRSYKATWDSIESADLVHDPDDFQEQLLTPEEAVWKSVKPVILSRLTFHRNLDLLDPFKRGDMEQIARLIGFNYDEAWEAICKTEAPIPKSWGTGFDPMTLIQEGFKRDAAA